MKFYITKHAKDRYKERIHNNLNVSENLMKEIFNVLKNYKDITNKVYDECPRYILYLYEKYGTANYKIISANNIIFLCQKREGTLNLYDIITCYHENSSYISQFKTTVLTRDEIYFKIKMFKSKNKK